MEVAKLIVLLTCCAGAQPREMRERLFKRSLGQHVLSSTSGSLLKPGFKIITELPQPAPGFFLNRHFQNQAQETKHEQVKKPTAGQSLFSLAEEAQPEAGFYLNRQFQEISSPEVAARNDLDKPRNVVVDNTGRQWIVAEAIQPEPGFFLNRQFQKKNDEKATPSSNAESTNEVFLRKENTTPLAREPTPLTSVLQPALGLFSSSGTSHEVATPRPNVFTFIAPQIATIPSDPSTRVSSVSSSQARTGPLTTSSNDLPKRQQSLPPSFIVRQLINNQKTERKENIGAALAHPPQRSSSSPQQKQDSQLAGFSCEGKPYGYYSDVESKCQQYHICNPINFSGGFVQYYKYSFSCSSNLQWDPVQKVCMPKAIASPCQ